MSKDDAKIVHYFLGRFVTLGLALSYINVIVNSTRRQSMLYGAISSYFLLRAKHYNDLLKEELE